MTTEQMRARRAKMIAELRELDDKADDETGALSAEDQAAFDTIKAALAKLEIALTRSQDMDSLERRSAGTPIGETRATVRVAGRDAPLPAGFDGRVMVTQTGERVPVLEARHQLSAFGRPEEQSGISFGGFLRALHSGPRDDVERRAMAEATIGTGGALLPTPLSLTILDLLRSRCVSFQAGAVTVPMETATLRFARQIADPIGGWRAELAPIVEGQPAFDAVTLIARSWALLVRISRELLEDGQNTDAVLQNIFARTAALALDRAILYGAGVNNEPMGIANTPGIQVVSMGANGGQLTNRGPLLDAKMALELANVADVSAVIMSPRSARELNGLADSLGQPLRLPPSLEDVQILTTTSVSTTETQGTATNASSILLGDFSQVMVGMRTALQVSILQEHYADTGAVGFILWMRVDVVAQHPAALARIEGIVP